MSEQLFIRDILFGKLEQVYSSPGSAHCWHDLARSLSETKEFRSAHQEIFQKLVKYTPASLESRFLQTTFMFGLTHESRWLEAAGLALASITPVSIDRIQSLLLYVWGYSLSTVEDRNAFIGAHSSVNAAGLLKSMAGVLEFGLENKFPRSETTDISKIAVVTPHVSNLNVPATIMALKHVQLLLDSGKVVELFVPQEHDLPAMPNYLGNAQIFTKPVFDMNSLNNEIRGTMKLTIANTELSLLQRWRLIISRIAAFNPDVVLFVGFFSPLPFYLYRRRPMLCLSIHTVPPIVPADVWLCHDECIKGEENMTWGHDLSVCHTHYYPNRVALRPAEHRITREDIGVDPESVVLITVGTRLHAEITRTWAEKMLVFMEQHPKLIWLLVGGSGAMLPVFDGMDTSRIKIMPFHSDVRSLYRCCDISVNPPRMGGGFSIATAMAEGLAVVAYAGSDGGDKIGLRASLDDADFVRRLNGLIVSKELRMEEGKALQEQFVTRLDVANGGPGLLAACSKAQELFHQRIREQ